MRLLPGCPARPSSIRFHRLFQPFLENSRPISTESPSYTIYRYRVGLASEATPTLGAVQRRARASAVEKQFHNHQHKHLYSTWIPGARPRDYLSLFITFTAGFGVGFSLLLTFRPRRNKTQLKPLAADESVDDIIDMTELAPGRPGNLTPEQEEKLRRLWQLTFQVTGVETSAEEAGDNSAAVAADSPAAGDAKKPKKKRISLFSRKSKKDAEPEAEPATPSKVISLKEGDEDKYGQTKHFFDTLASQSPESIRTTIWGMVKHDHPDALLLRFLRARKWDVEKALVMCISTMNWRRNEMHVDDDIMATGEGAAFEDESGTDPEKKKLGSDFLAQVRMGKSFVHGVDKDGRPICVVRVRLHKAGEQAESSLERYTVYLIETCRFLLKPPVDTATIVFDMTGFTMANMDYTPVKFMIKCFEANYPESLGAVLVHKAPWVFQGIWKIIKGWLDPVVASKIHFTNNLKELQEYIPVKQIPKELDGEEDWEYKFVDPIPGENDKMKDTGTRDRLLAARELLVQEFEQATVEWIQNPEGEKATLLKAKRTALAAKLREDYFNLDPYIRARSWYDRTGVLLPGGKLDFYPQSKPVEKPNGAAETAAPAAETSADDVD